MKQILVHGIITQEGNWVFVTQFEIYVKEARIDDVAIISKHDVYKDKLTINMEKCQEGRNTWYELRLMFGKIEVIVTGGISGNNNNMEAFLGVSAPATMAHDSHFLLLSPTQPAEASSTVRASRNYMKKASLFPWLVQSAFFEKKQFATISALELHMSEDGFAGIASEVLDLMTKKRLTNRRRQRLISGLESLQYWKLLGFQRKPKQAQAIRRISKLQSKIPAGKKALIDLLLTYNVNDNIPVKQLLLIHSRIIRSKLNSIHNKRVKLLLS